MMDRETMREYMYAKRLKWKSEGLCQQCGKRSADERYTTCEDCRYLARRRQKRYREQRKAETSETFEEWMDREVGV